MVQKIIKFLPAFLWMGVIFYFSSRQTTGIGGDSYWFRFAILKTFHFIEYAILAIFLFLGYKKYKWTFLTAYIYALSDEFHQHFIPGRTGQFRDTFFDLTGILLALLVFKFFQKRPILKK